MIKDSKPKNATDVDDDGSFLLSSSSSCTTDERSTRLRNSCQRNRCDFYTVHAITIILPYATQSRTRRDSRLDGKYLLNGNLVEKYVTSSITFMIDILAPIP